MIKQGACCAHGGQGGPKIMLAAHMDEIGFLVKHITKEGFLKFTNLEVGGPRHVRPASYGADF